MGNLTGHRAPGLVALHLFQQHRTLRKVLDHLVVCMNKGGNFINAVIFNLFQIVNIRPVHFLAQGHKRLEEPVHNGRNHKAGKKKQYEEYGQNADQMHHGLILEIVVIIGER